MTMNAGREIDALVAEKVMGLCAHKWEYKSRPARDPCPTCGEDRSNAIDWDGDYPPKHCAKCGFEGTPHVLYSVVPDCKRYSTSIAAAREMEDQIERRGLKTKYAQALVVISLEQGLEFVHDEELWWFFIHATPRQRCVAALKAVDVDITAEGAA